MLQVSTTPLFSEEEKTVARPPIAPPLSVS